MNETTHADSIAAEQLLDALRERTRLDPDAPHVIALDANTVAALRPESTFSASPLGVPRRVDITINSDADLQSVIDRVSFKNSNLDWNWKFHFRPIDPDGRQNGWFLWASFVRPDTHSGEVGPGRGRDEVVWKGASESSVVKTCWVLVEMLVKHELMEGFRYEDMRIFDPHNTVGDLQLAQKIGSRGDMNCTYMDQEAAAKK